MKPEYFIKLAKKESAKSDHHSHKLGCIIVKNNKVIGMGHNRLKTHTKSWHPHKSIHAEFMAALNCNFDLRDSVIYVYREHKNGVSALSRPCPSCWKWLMQSGAKSVIYTLNGTFKEESMK